MPIYGHFITSARFPCRNPCVDCLSRPAALFDQQYQFLKRLITHWAPSRPSWGRTCTPYSCRALSARPFFSSASSRALSRSNRDTADEKADISVGLSQSQCFIAASMWLARPGSGSAFASLASANSASPTLFSYLLIFGVIFYCVKIFSCNLGTTTEYKFAHLSLAFVNFSAWNS